MTETTQSVESKTTETKTMNTYYISNEQVACMPILCPFTLEHADWPIVLTPPSSDFKQPKYDWTNNCWTDNDAESTSQKVMALTEQVEELQKDKEASDQTNSENSKQMQAMQQMLTNSNAMTGQISAQMTQFGNAITQLTEAVNKITSTTSQSANSVTTEKDGDE